MSIYCYESGPKEGQTIVFLHGGGLGGWMWEKHIKYLGEYHCLVPDIPEHGESINEGPFTIKGCANEIAQLIREKAHGGKAHVVGLSLGAQIALELLSTSPEVVDQAVIASALVRHVPLAGLNAASARYLMPLIRNRSFQKLQARVYHIPEEQFEKYYDYARNVSREAFERMSLENMNYRLPEGLDKIAAHVLVLAGQRELGVMKKSAEDIIKAIPGSRGYIISGADHSFSIQYPDLFTHIIRAWFAGSELPLDKLKAL